MMTAPPRRSACDLAPPRSGPACRTTDSTPLAPGVREPSSTVIAQPHREDSQPASSWAVRVGRVALDPAALDGDRLAAAAGRPSRGWRRGSPATRWSGSRPGRCRRARSPSARVLQRGHRVVGDRAVGDPAVGEDRQRVGGQPVRRLAVPPGDDGGVGGQQRQHDRLGVQRQPAVHPHDDRLAGPEPAADRRTSASRRGSRRVELPPDHDQQPAGVRLGRVGRGLLGLGRPGSRRRRRPG